MLYIGTAVLGSLVQYIHPAHESYFSDKRNLFNTAFVKYGWGWTSILYLPFVTIAFARLDIKKAAPFWFRWLLATLYWYFITQNFVGPSITDRFFTWSGGACSIDDVHDSFTCKVNGGKWSGGHDMSGHCMLLIHASLFLWEELRIGWFNTRLNTRIKEQLSSRLLGIGLIALWFLWWWMLLMTNVYFHTIREKVSGVLFGYFYWIVSYGFVLPLTPFPGVPAQNLQSSL
ncbi:hypothetical protein K493DRAFT_253502 [Basidiobolus meristosporus CBS 931.73]|uniref:Uncharacterized protein n=1 Tax=Basidiobolus meristosporus CBS 931.73 TaxID=1314790 RepID=A0A1Y1Z2L8_9FUNG|nr:hypothetical protein K493DRAFT_253502 [Basidiobolus meristosporus CBS 931.73]|eukprot:ORY04426.1 hypothetical protein K493DRAFT_253502 [Basidiobolus meristosporus CBS 931.73]